MTWIIKNNLDGSSNHSWVMWGNKGAMYALRRKRSQRNMQEMIKRVRQWFFIG